MGLAGAFIGLRVALTEELKWLGRALFELKELTGPAVEEFSRNSASGTLLDESSWNSALSVVSSKLTESFSSAFGLVSVSDDEESESESVESESDESESEESESEESWLVFLALGESMERMALKENSSYFLYFLGDLGGNSALNTMVGAGLHRTGGGQTELHMY